MILFVCDLSALCAFVSFVGPLVLPYFSLWKLLPDTGLKEISEETVSWRLNSTIWNFPLTAWYREIPGLTTNDILDWLLASSMHHCNLHSRNHRISKTTDCVLIHSTFHVKGMVTIYGLSPLAVKVEPWYIPEVSQNMLWVRCSARRIAEYHVAYNK
jgi:hypothetical protein